MNEKNEIKLHEIHNFHLPETNTWARTPMVTATTVSNNKRRRAVIHGFKTLLRVPSPAVLWKRKLTSYSYMVMVTGFPVFIWIRSSCFGLPFSARRYLSSVFIKVILVWREVLKRSGSENPWFAPGFYFWRHWLSVVAGPDLALWSKAWKRMFSLLPPTFFFSLFSVYPFRVYRVISNLLSYLFFIF